MAVSAKVLGALRAILAEQIAANPANVYELDESNGIVYVSTPEADTWWGIYSATIFDTVVNCMTLAPGGGFSTVLHKKKGGAQS